MATRAIDRASAKPDTFFERHAWKVFVGITLVIGLFGILDLTGGASDLQNGETVLMHSLTGLSWNELQAGSPGAANLIDWKFRSDGATLFTIAMLTIAVCLTGFRRGQRWAWYALWAIPFWFVLTILSILAAVKHPGYGTPVPVISGSVFLVLWVAMLGLSYRRFFR